MKNINLLGKTFRHLEVKEDLGMSDTIYSGQRRHKWLCKCSCGRFVEVITNDLTGGRKYSCGCMDRAYYKNGKLRDDPKRVSERRLFSKQKNLSERRNLIWELTLKNFVLLIGSNCVYCGVPPLKRYSAYVTRNGNTLFKTITKRVENSWIIYNGIDREDSDKGYTVENSVACCTVCNFAKGRLTRDEFLSWIKRAYEFNKLDQSNLPCYNIVESYDRGFWDFKHENLRR